MYGQAGPFFFKMAPIKLATGQLFSSCHFLSNFEIVNSIIHKHVILFLFTYYSIPMNKVWNQI